MGLTFDDDNPDATPTSEMRRILESDPSCEALISPYLGGEELNASPTHVHRRYVINFGSRSLDEAGNWPKLLAIVQAKVKPGRDKLKRGVYRDKWWQFAEKQQSLYVATAGLKFVLAVARHQSNWSVARLMARGIFSEATVVLAFESCAAFALIQSRIHETWARFFGSSMKDDLRYTPTDCFETFPFPSGPSASDGSDLPTTEPSIPSLEAAGTEYYEARCAVMVKNNEGLTKTYHRFHESEERSPDIRRLRDLHAEMDRAVLDAYGWTDIVPVYDFREQLDENIRLTWADETRDDVLARLLELNRVRAAAEAQAQSDADASKRTTGAPARKAASYKKGSKKSKAASATADLFNEGKKP